MKLINRGILVLKPNRYFLEWLNQLPDNIPGEPAYTLDEIRQDCTAFLLPDVVSEGSISYILEPIKTNLFEMELTDWCTNPEWWPPDRSSSTFDQWFDIEFHSMIWDLLDLPIQASEEEQEFDPLIDDFPDDSPTVSTDVAIFEPGLPFKRQDSVVVKEAVCEPGRPHNDISAWQGRVIDFMEGDHGEVLALVEWDSPTLLKMPTTFIEERAEHSWDWEAMSLNIDCLELAHPRDTYYQVERMQARISARHFWPLISSSGERIAAFLMKLDPAEDSSIFSAWHDWLVSRLKFPFEACMESSTPGSPAIKGDFVTVAGLAHYDSLSGVQVQVNYRNSILRLPLANLIVLNETSQNHQLVDDYKLWYDYTL